MTDVAIVGASGYAARELIRILLGTPGPRVTAATSRQDEGTAARRPASRASPAGSTWLRAVRRRPGGRRRAVAFLGPAAHGEPRRRSRLARAGVRVIDLERRLPPERPDVYAQWYGHDHTDPDGPGRGGLRPARTVPRADPAASLIANPGCYTRPASWPGAAGRRGPDRATGIIIDAKSGVSGAGRTPKLTTHFPECNESISAYSVGRHRHTPEIDQVLTDVGRRRPGEPVEVIFTPHLVPMDRGIFATIYATPTGDGRRARPDRAVPVRSTPTARSSAWSVTCPRRRTRPTRNFCDMTVRVVRGQDRGDGLPGQPDQGRGGRGGAEFQPDVRPSRETALF